jgi:hypothetical protein
MTKVREEFEAFKRGEADALAVKDSVESALGAARGRGDAAVAEELEDMLMDLESSIEDTRCQCHRKTSFC